MTRILLLVLALAAPARATVLFMDSFDDVDPNGNEDFITTNHSSGRAYMSSVRKHNAIAGGSNSSGFSLHLKPTASGDAYRTLGTTLNPQSDDPLCYDFSLAVVTSPASQVSGPYIKEQNGNQGCSIYFNADGSLELNYPFVDDVGATAVLPKKVCCNTDGTNCDSRSPCAVNADCGTLKQCGTNSCNSGNLGTYGNTCSVNGDCGSGGTCIKNICDDVLTASGLGTERGCYWAGLRLCELVTGTTQVQCDLWRDGRHELASGAQTGSGFARPNDVIMGTVAVGAQEFYIASVVLDNEGSQAGGGYDYVVNMAPATVISTLWTDGADCNTGNGKTVGCLNDWSGTGGLYNDGTTNSNTDTSGTPGARILSVGPMVDAITINPGGGKTGSPISLRTGEAVKATQLVLAGNTTATSGNRFLFANIQNCVGASCAAVQSTAGGFSLAVESVPTLWFQQVFLQSPLQGGGLGNWTPTLLGQAGFFVQTCTGNNSPVPCTGANAQSSRLSAATLMAAIRKPDLPIVVNLRDHNAGTDDGKVSVYTLGDSTNGGTVGATCPDGLTACTQNDYCSSTTYSGLYEFNDHPPGGCGGNSTICVTCTGRRTETVTGLGYPCDNVTFLCGDNGATCTSGVCSQNSLVPCAVAADCNVANLGTCDTTATCANSCPNAGTCPGHAQWGAQMAQQFGTDNLIRCWFGGESTYGLVNNRIPGILQGSSASCQADIGTGRCSCSINKDCGSCVRAPFRSCTVNADCAAVIPGDTCTTGTCTGGVCAGSTPVNRTACSAATDCNCTCQPGVSCNCANGCVFPPPDYLMTIEGYNDPLYIASSPNCDGAQSASAGNGGMGYCACASLACLGDSTCTAARGGHSYCAGAQVAGLDQSATCILGGYSGFCNVLSSFCNVDADCQSPLTCSGGSPGNYYLKGHCVCASDANCTTLASSLNLTLGFHCVNTMCRLDCTTDADCGGVSGSCSSSHCQGGCTCPSDTFTCSTGSTCSGGTCTNAPTAACTTDQQCKDLNCGGFTEILNDGQKHTFNGKCDPNGRCAGRGPDTCRTDTEVTGTNANGLTLGYTNFYKDRSHTLAVTMYDQAQADINALSESDGRPQLLVGTLPLPNSLECLDRAFQYSIGTHFDTTDYWQRLNAHFRDHYRQVFDAERALAALPSSTWHVDSVHYNLTGAAAVATPAVNLLNTLNTCASGKCLASKDIVGSSCGVDADCGKHCSRTHYTSCTGDPNCPAGETCKADVCTFSYEASAQRYCRKPDATWSSTTCTVDTDCTAPQTCSLRPCTCACNTNADCQHWFLPPGTTTGATCVAGKCKVGTGDPNDACRVVFGGSYACDATSGKCLIAGLTTDACPASGDVCNLE